MYGRDAELRTMRELLDGVRERGGALVVRGEPGIGKSFLLNAARARAEADGIRVLSAAGVQSEAHLPFAGLHQLLLPVLDRAQELPAPQRLALLTAFGMAESAVSDLFLVALAALELLAESAAETPLLVLAEDVQWLDRPSSDVLAFVGRRLESEPIVMLVALRDPSDNPLLRAGLDELPLSGLDDEAAAELLAAGAPGLSAADRRQVIEEAAGNPLALTELPIALRQALPTEAALPAGVLPLTSRLERAFASRMAGLPAETRAVLLAAAIDDLDDLDEILGVATALRGIPVPATALEPAVAAGLLEPGWDAVVRFRHPLVRSAVYHNASSGEIRHGHAALASLLADQPDRRAWHRASASAVPDEQAAVELERAAVRARQRGAMIVAVAAQQRAARLTPDRRRRGRRLLQAAQDAYELGDHELARSLRIEAEALPLDLSDRSRAAWLRGAFDDGKPGDTAGMRELIDLADRSRSQGHRDVALQLLVGAARRCWWGEPTQEMRTAVVRAAERVGADPGDARMIAIVGIAAAVERGAEVIGHLARWDPARDPDPAAAGMVGMAAFVVGDFERTAALITPIAEVLREQGRLGLLAQALVLLSFSSSYLGDLDTARQAAAEADRLAEETAQPVWAACAQLGEANMAALRGDIAAAERFVDRAARSAFTTNNGALLNGVLLARGLIALAGEQYEAAYAHLSRMFHPGDPAFHSVQQFWAIGYLAEAAVHCGRHDEGRALLARLERQAAATGSPGIELGMCYARAVLATEDRAEELFKAALASSTARWPYHRARLQLAQGGWLRRQRRSVESRVPLRAAATALDSLGVAPWAARARQELQAAGEASQAPVPGGWDLLSPQERQIARLVAQGLSNREIGQRLYVSHRTVGSHLYRIFPKLGVTSRTQLLSVLAAAERDEGAVKRL